MTAKAPDDSPNVRPTVSMDPAATFRHLVPVSKLQDFITPIEDVYVVAHMGVARVDPAPWRLRIEGMVERPLVFDRDELMRLPTQELTAVIECYGNPVEPHVPTRRVGNVVWRGVPLAEMLARAGVRPEATSVWLEGLDSGTFATIYSERYIKDLPLARALQGDVLVAYAMNGEPLTPEHGFPARAFVPGYFGTNSVKWLSRITLAAGRPESLFTTRLYNRRVLIDGGERVEPVREMDVHAVIVRPADEDRLAPGGQRVAGWAWSAWPVTRIEVSTDGGASWREAQLEARGVGPTWQRFAFEWEATAPGTYQIRCRAADSQGRVQPNEGRNRIHGITVTVV